MPEESTSAGGYDYSFNALNIEYVNEKRALHYDTNPLTVSEVAAQAAQVYAEELD